MIELMFLIAALAGFSETAKRRGTKGWPFILVAGLGWVLFTILGLALVGPGPHFLISWGFVGLVYGSLFVIGGGGRQMASSWQCPDCRLYNPPSTLICPCGHDPSLGS